MRPRVNKFVDLLEVDLSSRQDFLRQNAFIAFLIDLQFGVRVSDGCSLSNVVTCPLKSGRVVRVPTARLDMVHVAGRVVRVQRYFGQRLHVLVRFIP